MHVRIRTHRALVVIGNFKGTAGYGSGKGKQAKDALEAAFRSGPHIFSYRQKDIIQHTYIHCFFVELLFAT